MFLHLENTHFRSGAKTILHRTQQAESLETVAFQVEHGIHDVFQDARPGNDALFGHVADDENGYSRGLGQLAQAPRAFADLGDRPGGRADLGDVHGLDRVDDHQVGFDAGDVFEDAFQVGFGHQEELVGHFFRLALTAAVVVAQAQQAQGAHFDLALRFLTGNVEDGAAFGHFHGHLQHQGRLTDAGVAADQDD